MTTVGYGDIAPKSIRARIFSILWILGGIILFSILSGKLTTVILEANTIQPRTMAGERVGVLRNRMYDDTLVAMNGGESRIVDDLQGDYLKSDNHFDADVESSELEEFKALIGALQKGRLDGILLDKYTYWDMVDTLKNNQSDEASYILNHTMTTDVPQSGDEVSYGILIKNENQYLLFKQVFESNKMIFQKAVALHFNKHQGESPLNENNMFREYFLGNIGPICGTIIAIGCFAFFLELHRKRGSKAKKKNDIGKGFIRTEKGDDDEEEEQMV